MLYYANDKSEMLKDFYKGCKKIWPELSHLMVGNLKVTPALLKDEELYYSLEEIDGGPVDVYDNFGWRGVIDLTSYPNNCGKVIISNCAILEFGRGRGTEFLKLILKVLKKQDYSCVECTVNDSEGNLIFKRMAEKQGFKVVSEWTNKRSGRKICTMQKIFN